MGRMCLCAFSFVSNRENSKTDFKLILVFNRDEFYARPTEPLHDWSDSYQDERSSIIGGGDREPGREGGSWMTLSKKGKLAALTNHLTPKIISNMKGRGNLVVDYCKNESLSSEEYFNSLALDEYNPFNLLLIDFIANDVKVFNNIDKQLIDIEESTVNVLSNSQKLNSDWLKSKSLSSKFEKVIDMELSKNQLVTELFAILEDSTTCGNDPLVTEQGGGKIEKFVGMENYSAIKIDSTSAEAVYGTRSHAVILVDFDNNVEFIEKNRVSDVKWESNMIT